MYCIDTEALVFMFNGGSSYSFTTVFPPIEAPGAKERVRGASIFLPKCIKFWNKYRKER